MAHGIGFGGMGSPDFDGRVVRRGLYCIGICGGVCILRCHGAAHRFVLE